MDNMADEVQETSDEQSSSSHVCSATIFPSKGVKRKALMVDEFSENFGVIAKSFDRIADALFEANRVAREGQHRIITGEEVYAELKKLEVANDEFFAVYDLLVTDQAAARVLFGLPAELRKEWLSWKMSRTQCQ